MSTFRKTTLRDVARHAGVSPTTVSEFLSGRPNACSAGTAARIQQAVEELHYTPSALGASLRKAATHTIGLTLVFPSVSHVRFSNFLPRLWEGITEEAFGQQHSILFYEDAIRLNLSEYRVFLDGRVDGVILQPSPGDRRPLRLAEAGLPVALVSVHAEAYPGCIAVLSDEQEIVRTALEHLWELGHRRIAHFAGPVHSEVEAGQTVAAERCRAYRRFCEERGIFDPELVFASEWWRCRDFSVLAHWHRLPDPPTALFCATDALALQILDQLAERNWRVPEELSLISVDNTIVAETHSPAISTVEYPIEEQGRAAVRALIARISGEAVPLETLIIHGARLIARQTTIPPLAAPGRRYSPRYGTTG